MCSVRSDQTAAAAIRTAAMELFGECGYSGVTVREIASAAGVSPGLVIHHYGSKEGLREVLADRVAATVELMLAELTQAPEAGGSATVAELFARQLEREPAMAAYVRRLLSDGGPAGMALFARLLDATRSGVESLEQAGIVRPAQDAIVRDAILLCNDLAMVLLRPHMIEVLGIDPLAHDGLHRWSETAFDIYTQGIFLPPAEDSTAMKEISSGAHRGGRRR